MQRQETKIVTFYGSAKAHLTASSCWLPCASETVARSGWKPSLAINGHWMGVYGLRRQCWDEAIRIYAWYDLAAVDWNFYREKRRVCGRREQRSTLDQQSRH